MKYLHSMLRIILDANTPTEKLIAHLGKREHIVSHYLELQRAINEGFKLSKIHKMMSFRQEAFAREFVMINNELRKEASRREDEFGKAFYKLMNNSCFGQMMMNELEFKRGKLIYGSRKIRGGDVLNRKIALSDPKILDYYDIDNDEYIWNIFTEQ